MAFVLVLGLSADLSACPNCKEAVALQPNEQANMQNGFNWSVLFMMGMPFTLLGTGAFMVARGIKQGPSSRDVMNPKQDLERAAALLAEAGQVAVLTGAGISAESGVPTFRGLGGLWNGRDPMSLATPDAFATDPALVWEFYNWRRALVAGVEPNPGHRALAELGGRLPRLTLITQNVDRLHQRAGSRDVLEVHGNLMEVRCTGCGRTSDRTGETLPALPRCEDCGDLLRPGVVWFGETLPPTVWEAAETAVGTARLLLVVGTSAVVYPAAGLAATAQIAGVPVIEINLEPTPLSTQADLVLQGKAAEILPLLVRLSATTSPGPRTIP